MTTRAERLANAEKLAREQLERQRIRLAKVQAQQREEERRALTKRRLVVGELADQAGLFALDDTTLAGLFALLATLKALPDPVAVLDALLCDAMLGTTAHREAIMPDICDHLGTVVPGCAHRGDGVSTPC